MICLVKTLDEASRFVLITSPTDRRLVTGMGAIDRAGLSQPDWSLPTRMANGSDEDSMGTWPEKGILAPQPGPNRNGRTG